MPSEMVVRREAVQILDDERVVFVADMSHALAAGGSFVTKLFQGEGFDDYVKLVRARFGRVSVKKPAASRPRSREVYLVARNYRV